VKLARQIVTKSALHAHRDNDFVPGTEAERILMVWPITREIAALNPDYDVERVQYDEASRNAVEREIDGIRIRILSVQDFIRNKLACGRPKDLADAELLRDRTQ